MLEPPRVGEIVGGYRLDELLARGGMGEVYSATHTRIGRRVAVKILSAPFAEDASAVSRFLYEAKIANDIRHPNIVEIYDFVESKDPPIVACVMELLYGPTLAAALRRGPFSLIQALNLTLQMMDALMPAHRAGVIHRDLKPANIIVIGNLDSDLSHVPSVKILDFGIAKVPRKEAMHQTHTGALLGTPSYMSPEQAAGIPVSPATDLFALAEILFEMLAGRPLYTGNTLQILRQKLAGKLPNMDLPDGVYAPRSLMESLRACLSTEPEDRPTVETVRGGLESLRANVKVDPKAHSLPSPPADAKTADEPKTEPEHMALDIDPQASAPGRLPLELPPPPEYFGAVEEPQTGPKTAVFYQQIKEDFDELPPQEEPRLPVPSARLYQSDDLHEIAAVGALHREAKARPPGIPVVVGTAAPERQPKHRVGPSARVVPKIRKTRWPLIFALLFLGLSLLAVSWYRPDLVESLVARLPYELIQSIAGDKLPNPLEAELVRWRATHGALSGTAADFIASAELASLADSWEGYERAETELQKALLAQGDEARAIGLLVENRVMWRGPRLLEAELKAAHEQLRYAASVGPSEPAVPRARAALAHLEGELTRCRTAVQETLSHGPNDPRARILGVECDRPLGPDQALKSLEDIGLGQEPPPRLLRVRATFAAKGGHYTRALVLSGQRLASQPDEFFGLLDRARLEAEVSRGAQAKKFFEQAIKVRGDSELARLEYARWLARTDGEKEAIKQLKPVAESPNAPIHYRLLALKELSLLDREGALEAARYAESLDEKDPRSMAALAGSTEGEESRRWAQLLLAGQTRDPAALALVGMIEFGAGRLTDALKAFDRACPEDRSDPRLLALRAAVQVVSGQAPAALSTTNEIASMDPREIHADDRRILHHLHSKKMELVLAQLEDLFDEKDRGDLARTVSGVLHYHLGASDVALGILRPIPAARAPTAALVYLIQLELERGNLTEADQHLRGLEKHERAVAIGLLLGGRVMATRRKWGPAEVAFERAGAQDATLLLATLEGAVAQIAQAKADQAAPRLAQLHRRAPYFFEAKKLLHSAGY